MSRFIRERFVFRRQNLVGILLLLGIAFSEPSQASNLTGSIVPPVIASSQATPESTGTANGLPFKVRLLELRRSGKNVIARFRFTNTAENPFNLLFLQTALSQNPQPNNPQNPDYNTISAIYAVDTETQEKYEVMRDRNNRPMCSRVDSAISPNKPIEMFAQFAVPPTTNRLTLYFPSAGAFIDVPILPPRR